MVGPLIPTESTHRRTSSCTAAHETQGQHTAGCERDRRRCGGHGSISARRYAVTAEQEQECDSHGAGGSTTTGRAQQPRDVGEQGQSWGVAPSGTWRRGSGQAGKKKSTAEAALLATIEELRGTIPDLRAEIAALRKPAPTQKLAQTERAASSEHQRERRPSALSTPAQTQRRQLAQATTKPSYAKVTQATARKARPQTKMVVRRQPLAVGIPLQLVAEELHGTADKGGYRAV